MVFLDSNQGNVSKTKPLKNIVENMSENVVEVSKPCTKTQDVYLKNLTHTLDFLHAYDKPSKEDNIDKIQGKKSVEEPTKDVPIIDTYIEDIQNGKNVDSEDSSDDESKVKQDNVVKNVVNMGNDNP